MGNFIKYYFKNYQTKYHYSKIINKMFLCLNFFPPSYLFPFPSFSFLLSPFSSLCWIEIYWNLSFVNSFWNLWNPEFIFPTFLCMHLEAVGFSMHISRNSSMAGFRKAEISKTLFTNENFSRFVSLSITIIIQNSLSGEYPT